MAFYEKQPKKVNIRRRLPDDGSVEGIAPDGKTLVSIVVNLRNRVPKTILRFTLN